MQRLSYEDSITAKASSAMLSSILSSKACKACHCVKCSMYYQRYIAYACVCGIKQWIAPQLRNDVGAPQQQRVYACTLLPRVPCMQCIE